MSNIKTVFEIKTFPNKGRKKSVHTKAISKDETITVNSVGQEAANTVDEHYKGTNTSKILKGFMIDEKFVPAELTSLWDNQKTRAIPIIN